MIALKNATLAHLHPAEVETGMDVVIDGPEIVATGRGAASGVHASRVIDCTGKLCMPGFVCAHSHIYSALSRGIMARIGPTPDFVSVLENLWWRLDRAIDAEILRASARVAVVDAVKAGCTAVIDHHASPSFITGSLDVIRKALEETGLRGILCYEVTDRNGEAGMEEGIAENARMAEQAEEEREKKGRGRLVEAMIGGHAPFTIPDQGLKALGDLVRNTQRGFHVHVSEDAFDPSYSHRVHRCDPLERLEAYGLLTDKSLVAHGVRMGRADRERLARRDSFLAHNARSNMNNGVGYMEAIAEVKRAVLGTDGIGADMLEELKFAFFKHRDAGGSLGPGDFTRMLASGCDLLGRSFSESFGKVRKGFMADLVVMDYQPPTPLEAANLAGHAVFGMSAAHVATVIVNGRIVMENRVFPFDVSEVYRSGQEAARRLWRRMDELPD